LDTLTTIYLFRNGDASKPPTTIELTVEGRSFIRLCRVNIPVEQPYAVVTKTRNDNSKIAISETVYEYKKNGGWTSRKTMIKQRDMDDTDKESKKRP